MDRECVIIKTCIWLNSSRHIDSQTQLDTFIHTPSYHFVFYSAIVCSWAFLLDVHRFYGANEGRLSHFLPQWLRMGWKESVISQGKIPRNTMPWVGIELGPRRGQTAGYIHSPSMSYNDWLGLYHTIGWYDSLDSRDCLWHQERLVECELDL